MYNIVPSKEQEMLHRLVMLPYIRRGGIRESLKDESLIRAKPNGFTALHALCIRIPFYEEFIPILLKKNININSQDLCTEYQNTALHLMIANEHSDSAIFFIGQAKKLKKIIDFNIQDNEGKTALILAVKAHQFDVALCLIETQEDKELRSKNVNLCDENGMTALHYACAYGALTLVQALIKVGAKINTKDNSDKMPSDYCDNNQLMIDAFLRAVEIDPTRDEHAKWNQILDKNAQPLRSVAKDNCGDICSLSSTKANVLAVCKFLKKGIEDSTKLLTEGVQDAKLEDHTWITESMRRFSGKSLSMVCLVGQKDVLAWFIRSASANNNTTELRRLLDNPMAVHCLNEVGPLTRRTALHSAAEKGYAEVCELLLSKGAQKNFKDKDGNTPFDLAKNNQHAAIVALLESDVSAQESHLSGVATLKK